MLTYSGCIYTTAEETLLQIYCIVFNFCVYTTATASATKIKEKNHFRFRSSINADLPSQLSAEMDPSGANVLSGHRVHVTLPG